MRLGILGAGSIGRRHAKNALMLGCDVVLSDCDLMRLIDAPDGVTTTTSWPEADAYIIATPAETHATMLGQVGRAPVLVEKPLFMTSPPACFAADIGPVVMVGYNLRFHQHDGLPLSPVSGFDPLEHFRYFDSRPRVMLQAWCHVDRASWPGQTYGDALSECSHEIDLACWLLGPAVVVAASVEADQWAIALRHAGGATSQITLGYGAHHDRGGLLSTPGHARRWSIARTVDETYVVELSSFLASVRAGTVLDPGCTFAQGLAVVKIIDEARAMARRTICE